MITKYHKLKIILITKILPINIIVQISSYANIRLRLEILLRCLKAINTRDALLSTTYCEQTDTENSYKLFP